MIKYMFKKSIDMIDYLIASRSSLDGTGLLLGGVAILVFKSVATWIAVAMIAYGLYRIFIDTE